jgi:N-acetylneuraminic acid mutarotase
LKREVTGLEHASREEGFFLRFSEFCGAEAGSSLRAAGRVWKERVQAAADEFVGWTVSVLVLVVGGNVGTASQQASCLQTCEYLEVATRLWKPLPPMHFPRFSPAVVSKGYEVFVVGGLANGMALETAEVLNCQTKKWTTLPSLHTRRSNPHMVTAHGRLYVLGGLSGGEIIRKLECLDLEKRDAWQQLPDMEECRTQMSFVVVGQWLVVIGGLTFSTASPTVEAFDTASGTWTKLPDMTLGRVSPQVVAIGTKLYVIGGRGGLHLEILSSMEVLDMTKKVWRQVADLPQPIHGPGIGHAGSKIFIFGGDIDGLPAQECYVLDTDAETPAWDKLPDMDMGVSSPVVIPVGPYHFIVLGGYALSKYRATVQYFKSEKGIWTVWAGSDAQMGAPRIGCGCASVPVVPRWAKEAGYVRRELRNETEGA